MLKLPICKHVKMQFQNISNDDNVCNHILISLHILGLINPVMIWLGEQKISMHTCTLMEKPQISEILTQEFYCSIPILEISR